MKVLKLALKDFKGITRGELELGPLTVLIGANNSGKTTVLESLFLAQNPMRSTPYYLEGHPLRALDVLTTLHHLRGMGAYRMFLRDYMVSEARIRCVLHTGETLSVSLTHDLRMRVQHRGMRRELDIQRAVWDKSFLGGEVLLLRHDLLGLLCTYIQHRWPEPAALGLTGEVAEELSSIAGEEYSDFTFEPYFGPEHAFYVVLAEGRRRIRVDDLGDGVQMLAVAMLMAGLIKPVLILWDDVETHMNPRALLLLARWLADKISEDIQVVLTTHSLEALMLIASTVEELVGVEAVIHLLSRRDGVLQSRRLKLEEVEELSRAGVDVRLGEGVLL